MRKMLIFAVAFALVTGVAQAGSIVNNGEIIVNTDIDLDWDISGNGTFSGDGTYHLFGTMSPGNSPGFTDWNADAVYEPGSELEIELAGLGGVAGEDFDVVRVFNSHTLTLGGTLKVIFYGDEIGADMLSVGDSFTFVTAEPDSSIVGSFSTLDFSQAQLNTGYYWDIIYTSSFVTLSVSQDTQQFTSERLPAPVPEPATVGLLSLGVIALAARSRKRIHF